MNPFRPLSWSKGRGNLEQGSHTWPSYLAIHSGPAWQWHLRGTSKKALGSSSSAVGLCSPCLSALVFLTLQVARLCHVTQKSTEGLFLNSLSQKTFSGWSLVSWSCHPTAPDASITSCCPQGKGWDTQPSLSVLQWSSCYQPLSICHQLSPLALLPARPNSFGVSQDTIAHPAPRRCPGVCSHMTCLLCFIPCVPPSSSLSAPTCPHREPLLLSVLRVLRPSSTRTLILFFSLFSLLLHFLLWFCEISYSQLECTAAHMFIFASSLSLMKNEDIKGFPGGTSGKGPTCQCR